MAEIAKIGVYAQDHRWKDIERVLADEAELLPQQDKDTLLCELSFYGTERPIRSLLGVQANVNFRFLYSGRSAVAYRLVAYPRTTPLGQTILGKAQGRFETLSVMQVLLSTAADPNLHTYQGYTPLQLAILQDCPDHAEALLSAGANPRLICEDPLIPEGDAFYFADQAGHQWARRLLSTIESQ